MCIRSWVRTAVGTGVGDRGKGALVGVAVAGGGRVGDGGGVEVGDEVEVGAAVVAVGLLWVPGAAARTVGSGAKVGVGLGLGLAAATVGLGVS